MALYVGAYYAIVQPGLMTRSCIYPRYVIPGSIELPSGEFLFAPIHAIDRRFRPDFWEPQWGLSIRDEPSV